MYGYGGGRRGGHHGHHRGHHGGFYAEGPVPALDEQTVALHQAMAGTFGAVRQIAVEGNTENAAKATELLIETRRALYRLLAGEAAAAE
jgi:hypothetical protein